MNRVWLSNCLIVGALAFLTLLAFPGCPGQANEGGAYGAAAVDKLLSKKAHVRAGEQRSLSLWQITPPASKPDEKRLAQILNTPNSLKTVDIASFAHTTGNLVFGVVDSSAVGAGGGSLVGVVYAMKDFTAPAALWSGDLVLEKSSGDAFVILARSKVLAITISVHRVSPAKKIAAFPYKFDPQTATGWPSPLKQLSELKTEIAGQCGIDKIEAELEGRVLVIRASRAAEKCSPTTFRVDTETWQWSSPK